MSYIYRLHFTIRIRIHCTQVDGPVLVLKHRCALLRYEGHHFEGTALVEFPHKERFSVHINFMEHIGDGRLDALMRRILLCFHFSSYILDNAGSRTDVQGGMLHP